MKPKITAFGWVVVVALFVVALVGLSLCSGCRTFEAVSGRSTPFGDRPDIGEAINRDIEEARPVLDLIPGAAEVAGIAGLLASLAFGYKKNRDAKGNYEALATVIRAIESRGSDPAAEAIKQKVASSSATNGTAATISTAVKSVT